MSFVRSTISHHLSSSVESSETFRASGGTSKFTLHTFSGTFVNPRLERLSCPDLRAWRSIASDTSPGLASPPGWRPNPPEFLARLCMIFFFFNFQNRLFNTTLLSICLDFCHTFTKEFFLRKKKNPKQQCSSEFSPVRPPYCSGSPLRRLGPSFTSKPIRNTVLQRGK